MADKRALLGNPLKNPIPKNTESFLEEIRQNFNNFRLSALKKKITNFPFSHYKNPRNKSDKPLKSFFLSIDQDESTNFRDTVQ